MDVEGPGWDVGQFVGVPALCFTLSSGFRDPCAIVSWGSGEHVLRAPEGSNAQRSTMNGEDMRLWRNDGTSRARMREPHAPPFCWGRMGRSVSF